MRPSGYRTNVGAILRREDGQVLLAERLDRQGWQLPQGGVDPGETHEEALWREVQEELGLAAPRACLRLVARGPAVRYDFPEGASWKIAREYRGQEQTLFLMDFWGRDADFQLDAHHTPEFHQVAWYAPEVALERMWHMKRHVLAGTFDALADVMLRGYVGPGLR